MARRGRRRKTPQVQAFTIKFGDTHLVEVKKGGGRIGIYLETRTRRRRGVVLPYQAWIDLLASLDAINLAIDFAGGVSFESSSSLSDSLFGSFTERNNVSNQACADAYQQRGGGESACFGPPTEERQGFQEIRYGEGAGISDQCADQCTDQWPDQWPDQWAEQWAGGEWDPQFAEMCDATTSGISFTDQLKETW
jgi:hypothetical protein